MFLWTGGKGTQTASHERRTIYQKIRGYDVLDKRKTVTALKAGEDRAILLGLAMILCAVMMYFVLGITVLRSYSDSVWTEETGCTVLNSSLAAEVNCSYSCGSDCLRSSSYPCLQVYVSPNASDRPVRLAYSELSLGLSPECFFAPQCGREAGAVRGAVQNVSDWLRAQRLLPCFLDPSGRREAAVLVRAHGPGSLWRSLLWPSCTLGGGALLIAMVKLTQYLSLLCEQVGKTQR